MAISLILEQTSVEPAFSVAETLLFASALNSTAMSFTGAVARYLPVTRAEVEVSAPAATKEPVSDLYRVLAPAIC